jgi:hypothetical protein
MSPEKLHQVLWKRPFQPFRIFMADGSSHEILHPELAVLDRRTLTVAEPQVPEEVPERTVLCDLLHVTRIEPTPGEKPKPRRGRSNGR